MGQYATAPNQNAWALTTKSWLCPPPAPPHLDSTGAGRAGSLDCFSALLKAGEFLLLRLLAPPICFGHSAELAALGNVPGLAEAAGSPA